MTACALFGGPVLTYRAFKQSAPRNIRGVANSEFAAAIRGLEEAGVGKVCSVQIPRVTYPVIVFVKEDPDKVQWPKDISLPPNSEGEGWSSQLRSGVATSLAYHQIPRGRGGLHNCVAA